MAKINYVSLGDSIAAGHTINEQWATNYGEGSQYGKNGNTETTLVPGCYTDLFKKDLEEKYGAANISVKSFARSGDTVEDLMAKLTHETVKNAIKEANIVTICIGANNVLQPAFGDLNTYIATGSLASAEAIIAQNLNNLENDSYPSSYTALFNMLYNINPKAKYIFTTIYNPYKYLWVEEGHNGFFKPLLDTIPSMTISINDMLGLPSWVPSLEFSLGSLIKDGLLNVSYVQQFFSRVNGLSSWAETYVTALNNVIKSRINAYSNPNFVVAETKALFDTYPDRTGVGDVKYNDLVSVEFTRGFDFAQADWGELWRDTYGDNGYTQYWSDLAWKYLSFNNALPSFNVMDYVSFDINGFANDVINQVVEKVLTPDVDPHPEEEGHKALQQSFRTVWSLRIHRAKPLGGIALNYEVVGGTTAPSAFKKENTIWVNTDTLINEHAFAHENPWIYYEDVDYIESSTIIEDSYLSDKGEVTAGDGANAPCYTENYIPVTYKTTYEVSYTLSASKSMWFAILEYTGTEYNYTFKQRILPVNQVTGTTQTFTYTPSADTVTAVRLSWRTFYPSGTTCVTFFGLHDVQFCTADVGDTWIQTSIDKAPINFNALNINELIVYPYKLRQWDGEKWKGKETYLLQDNNSEKICGAEFNAITDIEWSQSAYGEDKNNIVFTNTDTLKQVYLSTQGGKASGIMYFPIDLSQYETMTVSCSTSGTYAVGDIGFATHINDVYSPQASKVYDIELIEKFEGKSNGSCIDKVYDISTYNQTNAYFKMHMYDGSDAYSASSFNITKLVFE